MAIGGCDIGEIKSQKGRYSESENNETVERLLLRDRVGIEKGTAPGLPTWSPTVVLARPDAA